MTYYRRLYDLASADMLDRDLDDAIQALDFSAIARHYRLIEQDAIQVLGALFGESRAV